MLLDISLPITVDLSSLIMDSRLACDDDDDDGGCSSVLEALLKVTEYRQKARQYGSW